LEAYSEAIYCKVPPKKKAVYYSNRALVNMKCENYAIALFGKNTNSSSYVLDGKDCVKNDPTFVKGYYRCGSAYLALGQLDLAVKEFKQVCKLIPQDKDARDKYE
jgi:serine/threonine-protein phosphatase 5